MSGVIYYWDKAPPLKGISHVCSCPMSPLLVTTFVNTPLDECTPLPPPPRMCWPILGERRLVMPHVCGIMILDRVLVLQMTSSVSVGPEILRP